MTEQQNQICSASESGPETKKDRLGRAIRYTPVLVLLGAFSLVAGFQTARTTFPAPNLDSDLQALGSAPSVSPIRMPAPDNKFEA
jgi:hypothetical protein